MGLGLTPRVRLRGGLHGAHEPDLEMSIVAASGVHRPLLRSLEQATTDWTTDPRSITVIELLAGLVRVSTLVVVKGIAMTLDLRTHSRLRRPTSRS